MADTPACAPTPPDLKQSPLFCLHKAFHKAAMRAEELFDKHGLTYRELWVMMAVHNGDHQNQKQIADILSLNHNVMVKLIDRLEGLGMLERTRNPQNRREHSLILTEKGKSLVAQWRKEAKDMMKRKFAPLSAKDINELCRILAKFTEL